MSFLLGIRGHVSQGPPPLPRGRNHRPRRGPVTPCSLNPCLTDRTLETFLLFARPIPSQNLGFIDPKAQTLDITIRNKDYIVHQSPGVLSSNRAGGTTGAGEPAARAIEPFIGERGRVQGVSGANGRQCSGRLHLYSPHFYPTRQTPFSKPPFSRLHPQSWNWVAAYRLLQP